METSTQVNAATMHSGWALTRQTTLGVVLMGTLGALAGFMFARFLWM